MLSNSQQTRCFEKFQFNKEMSLLNNKISSLETALTVSDKMRQISANPEYTNFDEKLHSFTSEENLHSFTSEENLHSFTSEENLHTFTSVVRELVLQFGDYHTPYGYT